MPTALYADTDLFDTLRTRVMPALAARRGPVFIWVPACFQGGEAYTFAMLLEECGVPGLVVATDSDESALAWAMKAIYPEDDVALVPADLRERFLTKYHDHYRVSAPARHRVRFVSHDIATAKAPPPPGRFQVVSFRHLVVGMDPRLRRHMLASARVGLERDGLVIVDQEYQLARGSEALLGPSRYSQRILTAPGLTSSRLH
jgi:chemotaxis methyl-accepting protein methylase